MRRSLSPWLLTLVGSLALSSAAGAQEQALASRYSQLHTLIKPAPEEEAWNRIPWLSSLWEARRQAAAAGKPILLWEMDGHPLGCT